PHPLNDWFSPARLGVSDQTSELKPQPWLATPGHQLALGDRRPLALPSPDDEEEGDRISRYMAVNPAGRGIFNGQRAIVEDEMKCFTAADANVIGSAEAGGLGPVDKYARIGRPDDGDDEPGKHHGGMGRHYPPWTPGSAGNVISMHDSLVECVVSKGGLVERRAFDDPLAWGIKIFLCCTSAEVLLCQLVNTVSENDQIPLGIRRQSGAGHVVPVPHILDHRAGCDTGIAGNHGVERRQVLLCKAGHQ